MGRCCGIILSRIDGDGLGRSEEGREGLGVGGRVRDGREGALRVGEGRVGLKVGGRVQDGRGGAGRVGEGRGG